MKVALVHDYLMQGMRGAERVLATFHRIYPDAPIFTLMYEPASFGDALAGWTVRTSFLQPLRRLHKGLLWLMPRAIESLPLREFDLVISSSSAWAKSAIRGPHALHLSYCYSPARFLWWWSDAYLQSLHVNGAVKGLVRRSIPRLREWDRRTCARVDHFCAISRTVQRRILEHFGRDSQVIYPPVDTSRFTPSPEQGDYFLIVSHLNPYKRVDLAIEAFNSLGLPLIIVGEGPERERLQGLAGPHVEFTGARPDAEVADLMARCRAFVMPQEEDFGITAVEAQAAGRPVIAYGSGGATETVIAGETGVFFDRQEPQSLCEAIWRFERMDFEPQRCRQNALRFDTQRFVDEWTRFVAENTAGLGEQPLTGESL